MVTKRSNESSCCRTFFPPHPTNGPIGDYAFFLRAQINGTSFFSSKNAVTTGQHSSCALISSSTQARFSTKKKSTRGRTIAIGIVHVVVHFCNDSRLNKIKKGPGTRQSKPPPPRFPEPQQTQRDRQAQKRGVSFFFSPARREPLSDLIDRFRDIETAAANVSRHLCAKCTSLASSPKKEKHVQDVWRHDGLPQGAGRAPVQIVPARKGKPCQKRREKK